MRGGGPGVQKAQFNICLGYYEVGLRSVYCLEILELLSDVVANERIVRDDLNYLEAREIGQYFTVVFWPYISIRYL